MLDLSHQTNDIFLLLYQYSYFVLFPLVVIEGPIVTLIAGFLASIGFMSFPLTYVVIVTADLMGDILYYYAGRIFPNINFKLKNNKIFIDRLNKHRGKILFFGKLSHAIGGPILFMAGNLRIPLVEFIWYNFLATLPKSLILLVIGFYFGITIIGSKKYFELTILGLFVLSIVLILIYTLTSKFFNKIIIDEKK